MTDQELAELTTGFKVKLSNYDEPRPDLLSVEENGTVIAVGSFVNEATELIQERVANNLLEEPGGEKLLGFVQEKGLDTPSFTLRFGDESVKLLEELGLSDAIDSKSASHGVLVFQLPRPLAKFWNKGGKDDDEEYKDLVKRGKIYRSVSKLTNYLVEEYAKDDILHLGRVNPVAKHDSDKYYYVWSVCDEESAKLLQEAAFLKSEKDIGGLIGVSGDDIFGKNNENDVVFVGPKTQLSYATKSEHFQQKDAVDSEDLIKQVGELEHNSIDSLVIPYVFPATIGNMEQEQKESLIRHISGSLKVGGKAYIFPLNNEVFEFNEEELEKLLAEFSWYNGGDLRTAIVQEGKYDTLILEKVDKTVNDEPDEVRRVSHNAIADAMVLAYGYTAEGNLHDRPEMNGKTMSEEELDNWTKEITFSECIANSTKTIKHLAAKYPDNFDRLILLESKANSKEHPFRNDSGKHAVFLARDISGRRYSGSPANFNPTDTDYPNPLTNIMESDSLADLLEQIKVSEGGDSWGVPEFIENGFLYVHPRSLSDPYKTKHEMITAVVQIDNDSRPVVQYME
jgi:hypothetical protein